MGFRSSSAATFLTRDGPHPAQFLEVFDLLKIAVPNKGRLSEGTLELFHNAGLRVDGGVHDRRLFATAHDHRIQLLFVRAADIPEYVQDGVAHLGVTGLDLVEETGKDVERLMDLRLGKCRLVVAVPQDSRVRSIKDVPEGARVASSFPRITRAFFESAGKRIRSVEVSGATEITPHIGVADLIVDLTSTGSTLAMNHLREVETILTSSAWVIGNRDAVNGAHAEQVQEILAAVDSVVQARGKRYLMANVRRDRLEEVRRVLPGINGPTIMDVMDHDQMVAAHAVVDERALNETIKKLKDLGASGILVLPIERLIP